MNAEELCTRLVDLMEEEAGLLEGAAKLELGLKTSIVSRDWAGLESVRGSMEPLFRRLGEIEARRHDAFLQLRGAVDEDVEAGFYEVLSHLTRESRERAADVYRTLKFSVLKIQGITRSIDTYLKTITSAMQEILAELFPFRKGNIYTRRGIASPTQSNPLVVDRHL